MTYVSESLTPEEHVRRADAALAAAKQVRDEMDIREQERGSTLGKASDWYLTKEHDFVTLTAIVNMHANMAMAKLMLESKQS